MKRAKNGKEDFWAGLVSWFRGGSRSPQTSSTDNDQAFSRQLNRAETPLGLYTYSDGMELVNDPHAGPIARFLKKYAPADYMQLFYSVINTTLEVRHFDARLVELEMDELAALQGLERAKVRVASKKAELNQQLFLPLLLPFVGFLRSFDRYDKIQATADTYALGLSFVIFQGLLEQARIELTNIAADEVFLVAATGIAALSITFSIKWIVSNMVQNRGLSSGSSEPFWQLFRKGDSTFYLSLVFVGIEIAMASPYFIQRLPLSLRDELFWRISACMCAGIFALVNVALGWSTGAKRLREAGSVVPTQGGSEPDSVNTLLEWRRSAYDELRKAKEDVVMFKEALSRFRRDITNVQGQLKVLKPKAVALGSDWQFKINQLVEQKKKDGVVFENEDFFDGMWQ